MAAEKAVPSSWVPAKKAQEENLSLWEHVQETDPRFTQKADDGRHKFTAIDAYYQIRTATQMWGPYGSSWGLFSIQYGYELLEKGLVTLSAEFRYPDGVFPITNSISITTSKGGVIPDFAKKVETDTITKCLSRLGFNADVFLGKFDDHRYVDALWKKAEEQEREERAPRKAPAPAKKEPQEETPLSRAREDFLRAVEELAEAATKKSPSGKVITGADLIEKRLSSVPGWPPGMPGEWSTVDMYNAAIDIITEKMDALRGGK